MKKIMLILSGVSGSGKDTIKNKLIEKNPNFTTLKSFTTRERRINEAENENYFFVSKEEFENKIQNNEFYEYSSHHNNYYGTEKKQLDSILESGKIIVKDIDVNGTEALEKIFKDTDIQVISIFLNVSKEELAFRLSNRDDKLTKEQIDIRLGRYDYEVSKMYIYTYAITNNDLDKTIEIIQKILEIETR